MADKRPETDSADNDNPAAEELQPENTEDLGPEQAETGDEGDTPSLAEALEAANEQIAALKDQALRGQADAENARRRAARDVENAHKFALEKFVGELLPVLDSLEKAIESAESSADGEAAAPIAEGVQLSMKLFLDVLAKAGITQVDPTGEPFDPQHHEAMAMVPNPDLEPNSVMEVMQKGYVLNGRLVRAAMVVVSKAPG
jgi:molecular chaperone GrpE